MERFVLQGLENHGPQVKSGPLPACVNKVLVKHSHTYSLMWCLLTTAEFSH